jgi:signal transduction histidine kinase
MSQARATEHIRIGLQLKSAVILTLIVLGVTAAGGWFYYDMARRSLRSSDQRHAARLAKVLGMAGQYDLRRAGRDGLLRDLVTDLLRMDNVRYVALVDADGLVVASACGEADPQRWAALVDLPVAISTTRQVSDDTLILTRPIITRDVSWYKERLVGAVRIAFDTQATTAKLKNVQRRMAAVGGAIVLCAIPIGYLGVWRLTLKPLRRLLAVTGRLARGDFAARSEIRRGDEIGRLAAAFDSMTERLARMRDELLEANEQLEQKVAERTEELQLANLRLRSEMSEKEEFLRAVSHDLNAPLRNVAGMATMVMIRWRDELPEEVIARLQRIQANVDEETSLIAELLELSRIRTRPQKRQVVEMGELLRHVAETFEYELRSRNIELDIAGPTPALYVEKSRIRKVFQNLIDNAIKYMHRREGGWIRIGYRREKRMHEFSVSDNGPGIPEDQHEKVFCIFRRADGAATAEVQGKGVGLAAVRSVVSNYDGRAWVESQPGRGATFFVALGIEDTQPPPEGGEDARADDESLQADYHPAGR